MHIDVLERYWLIAVGVTLGTFTAALLAGIFIFGLRTPSPVGRIDPTMIDQTEFAETGLRDMGNNRYEVYMLAQMWSFRPSEITVPAGAEVTFFVTSQDISHGFMVEDHDINVMLLPGQIARATTFFDEPGTYHIICHEYCGPGHHNMYATIIVEPATTADADTTK